MTQVMIHEDVAVIIVQWEAKEVLSQMNYRMSKSSLLVQVHPRALVGLMHLPSCLNLQHDSCVIISQVSA